MRQTALTASSVTSNAAKPYKPSKKILKHRDDLLKKIGQRKETAMTIVASN